MIRYLKIFGLMMLAGMAIGGCQELPMLAEATQTPTGTPLPSATQTSAPTLTPALTESAIVAGSNWVSPVDGMEMIYIPAGEFIMGWEGVDATITNGRGPTTDFLKHIVYVEDFWIDKYEVTNRQYQQCVAENACRPCNQNNIPPQGKEYFTSEGYANYPVINVSWYMARDYCEWAGRRLMTEAEWEKAARGTDGRKYQWGDQPYSEEYANMCDKDCPSSVRGEHGNPNFDDGYAGPAPVGSYPKGASPYGVLDMSGNVWEWTSTAEAAYPYDATDGRESQYDIADDSKWPERILRGSPWNDGYAYLRASFRYRAPASYWNFNMGIRCAYSE